MQKTQFKDTNGTLWTLSISIKNYITIRQKFGIDVADVFNKDSSWLAQLAAQDDLMSLIGIILEVSSDERKERGISEDEFFALFDGDTLEAATTAFIEAIVLFLPAHKQAAMQTVIEAVEMGLQKTEETMAASKDRLVQKVSETMDEAAKEVLEDLSK
jgi:hypothetical protein